MSRQMRLYFCTLVTVGVSLLTACTPQVVYVPQVVSKPAQNQTLQENTITEGLIAKYVFRGASAESVRSGLGEPSISTVTDQKATWVYDEVSENALSRKSSTLVIRFNSHNKVQSFDTHVTNIKK
jgi:hypothetical protein